jgi:hypothetical protein
MTTAASRRAVAEAAAKQILNATERPRKRLANAFGTAIDGRHPRERSSTDRLDLHDMFML